MKTNPLSVKKLMKKLILRALRQLYAVSEISFLIRWVTSPTKVENLQFEFFFFLKFLNFSNSSTLHCLHSSVDVLHLISLDIQTLTMLVIVWTASQRQAHAISSDDLWFVGPRRNRTAYLSPLQKLNTLLLDHAVLNYYG